MDAIRFKVEGILNSFRVPFFRTYQKSFLAPPKTTVMGMIANIMRKPENWYYDALRNDYFDVSVVIDNIGGRGKDLWSYKTLENKSGMHGRSIIRRDKLYRPRYTIYLVLNKESLSKHNINYDEMKDDILEALKYPSSIPSLGLDDEIIRIYDISEVALKVNNTGAIDSIFMDKNYKYTAKIKEKSLEIELPTSNIVPLSYAVGLENGQRTSRKDEDQYKQVEYINCEVYIEGVESYTDGINRMVFY